MKWKLDRNTGRINTFKEAADQTAYWHSKTVEERLSAAYYLTLKAWNLDPGQTHRLDKSVFKMRCRGQ